MMKGTCGGMRAVDATAEVVSRVARTMEAGAARLLPARWSSRCYLPGRTAMTLADLIDLEVQLARDQDAEPLDVERRDRALLSPGASGSAREVIGRWLEALREKERSQ